MRTEGGEPHAITREEEGFLYEWHPSGTHLVFVKPEREENKRESGKSVMEPLKRMTKNLHALICGG